MIFGFKRKLLSALLLANLVLVAVMASLMYWSFQRGFTHYLQQVEMEELQPLAAALVSAYEARGSWRFIRHNREVWGLFMRFLPSGLWEDEDPATIVDKLEQSLEHPPMYERQRPSRPHDGRPPPEPGMHPPPPSSNTGELNWRLKLLDGQKRVVHGQPGNSGSPHLIPLKLNTEVIGWLSVARLQWLEQELANKFASSQLVAVLLSALAALVLSLLLSLPLGKSILRPLSLVMEGIRHIARGELSHTVEWNNRDEFGQLVQDVNTLAATLEKNELLRRTMMADISHELRTPLAVLQAEIEAIQDGIRLCDADRLESLHKSVRGLSRLIDDLFDLSLADSGNLSYQKQETDVVILLERSYALYSNLFHKEEIQFTRDLPGRAVIMADPDRLNQVFSNILNNAYRYTDRPGEVRIRAKTTRAGIVIRFEDSSPGVTEQHQSKIFDRFFRVDRSRSRAHGGSGLGLALCKSIIKAHQGTIRADQSSLGGLTITITLPLREKGIKEDING